MQNFNKARWGKEHLLADTACETSMIGSQYNRKVFVYSYSKQKRVS